MGTMGNGGKYMNVTQQLYPAPRSTTFQSRTTTSLFYFLGMPTTPFILAADTYNDKNASNKTTNNFTLHLVLVLIGRCNYEYPVIHIYNGTPP
jgi:hypothetical protein